MNILPTMVQEAVSQCKRQGVVASAALATFIIRASLLTTKKDPQNNCEVSPDLIEQLVTSSVRSLCLTNAPMLETFKLQAAVTFAQQEHVNQLRTERVQHKAKSQRLVEEIYSKRDPSDVFHDMVLFVMHESRCHRAATTGGNASSTSSGYLSDDAAQRETVAALDSVFPRVLMDSFVAQKEAEKIRQLEEIWRIVWGIRLYNQATGRGGAGIPDCIGESDRTLRDVTEVALNLQEQLTASTKEYHAVLSSPSLKLSDSDRLRLQDEYYNRLQLKLYVRSLLVTIQGLTNRLLAFAPTWEAALHDATSLLASNADVSAVPKAAIYPKFMQVSERWDEAYALHREISDARNLFSILQSYVSTYHPTLRPSDVDHAYASLAEERAVNKDMLAAEVAPYTNLVYNPDLPQDKKEQRLEFNGFCVVSFVDDGLLADGKHDDSKSAPGYLMLVNNNAYYSFGSERALKAFAKDPFKYLSQALIDQVAATPVLIHLLGLHPYLPKELYLTGSRKHDVQRIVEKGDGTTQTGHIDSHKDTHYVWNEWELRRLALQLAGLRNKRTKSTQTAQSHFRRENDTQVFLPKTQGTQTAVDAAVQPVRVARYIKGLRGTDASRLEVVTKEFQY